MRNSANNFLVLRVALIVLIVSCLELIFRKFKCNLGEFFGLFWVNFLFLLVLFYWPPYLARKFNGNLSNSLAARFSLFFNVLFKIAFYMLFMAIFMVFILSYLQQGVSDYLLFVPLLIIWPIYAYLELKQHFIKCTLPLVISVFTLVVIQFLNVSNPSLATFDEYFPAFAEVAAMVQRGELPAQTSNNQISEIKLPCKYRYLIGCPNRKIVVKQQGNATEIFFCQDRSRFSQGITGFVYRSDGSDISNQKIRKLKENWFWQNVK
ncbi:hypothetical protein IQ264_05030 [Phormidium sp. LEGE 05292]|uniref:hypothetical protein n=1 Tax=[Phormidium] sp. LEGE 05292 TaxID=767427 RepID=UPI001881FC62|nr:hypothetical protein [Phormidium sp. LEGE 05292]MBE9224831.1 hypothetical protein [Phormidium sp. LEGE 05292]